MNQMNQKNRHYKDRGGYSYSGKPTQKKKKRSTLQIVLSVVAVVLGVALLGGGVTAIKFGGWLEAYTYKPQGSNNSQTDNSNAQGNNITVETFASPEKKGELYHDDAIYNILLMGLDDYHDGDVGRTDSMMLISIDRRHKKLKMTSFMRDLYVQIPDGWAPNRLNVAYTLGEADLLIRTIEDNFYCDIDRYVVVKFDKFADIIDTLGGVDIELTQAEADLVNQYTGDSSWSAKEGMNTLNGSQARSYSRIRNIGGDYERTQRQRKVFASLVNKFKGSNVVTLMGLADKIIPDIVSDLSQDEILYIVKNALTFMNYPMSECRIPADNMYADEWVVISGYDAAVLKPDLGITRLYLNDFLYEDSYPELRTTLEYNGYQSAVQ